MLQPPAEMRCMRMRQRCLPAGIGIPCAAMLPGCSCHCRAKSQLPAGTRSHRLVSVLPLARALNMPVCHRGQQSNLLTFGRGCSLSWTSKMAPQHEALQQDRGNNSSIRDRYRGYKHISSIIMAEHSDQSSPKWSQHSVTWNKEYHSSCSILRAVQQMSKILCKH